jgi:Zn-dependent membrane protease YugP
MALRGCCCGRRRSPRALERSQLKLSKITWSLFGLAMFFYALSWSTLGIAIAALGVLFEILMWVSIFFEAPKTENERDITVIGTADSQSGETKP